jgi:hypothetical protein
MATLTPLNALPLPVNAHAQCGQEEARPKLLAVHETLERQVWVAVLVAHAQDRQRACRDKCQQRIARHAERPALALLPLPCALCLPLLLPLNTIVASSFRQTLTPSRSRWQRGRVLYRHVRTRSGRNDAVPLNARWRHVPAQRVAPMRQRCQHLRLRRVRVHAAQVVEHGRVVQQRRQRRDGRRVLVHAAASAAAVEARAPLEQKPQQQQ